MTTALRRNTLIACAFGLVIVVGLVAERHYASRTPRSEQQAEPEVVQPRTAERATSDSSATSPTLAQFESSASSADSTAVKGVVIGVVTPWVEIARMPQYVQASPAERMAIRDLYWRTCVEEKIPLEQRTPTYWQFVRSWDSSEFGAPGSTARATSSQLLREQQPRVPSPVDAATMGRWCKR
jgi:hypothetical protein